MLILEIESNLCSFFALGIIKSFRNGYSKSLNVFNLLEGGNTLTRIVSSAVKYIVEGLMY